MGSTKERLYITGNVDGQSIYCPIESSVVIFILNYCENNKIQCCVVQQDEGTGCGNTLRVPLSSIPNVEILKDAPGDVKHCTIPAFQTECMVRTGLCAVLRHVIKTTDAAHPQRGLLKLLGYKGICLKSCAEVSVWTKFCEVEIPQFVRNLLQAHHDDPDLSSVPQELTKLENHLGQPPIIPNISKRRRQAMKKNTQEGYVQDTGEKIARREEFEHVYAEGTDMTLTDLILYPCVTCYLTRLKSDLMGVQKNLPRVFGWYRRLQGCLSIKQTGHIVGIPWVDLPPAGPESRPAHNHNHQSAVDVRDPNKKKFKAHSAQICQVLEKLERGNIHAVEEAHPCGDDVKLPWDDMPPAVHPAQGELPGSRVSRKCEQLENLARAVKYTAKPGYVIVDFCSGGGHLGILLAHLLPSCKVILVENKEESIGRAEKRIQALGLTNITMYQCNMNYFTGVFDIGVCLHACGVATDLVLQRCVDQQAAFIICPCCYWGIQNTHTLNYPCSSTFHNKHITYQDYLVLGHAADQTQVGIKQATDGKKCMLLIDMDRAELAREKGYSVSLCSLQPLSCSPKNNLLVGRLAC